MMNAAALLLLVGCASAEPAQVPYQPYHQPPPSTSTKTPQKQLPPYGVQQKLDGIDAQVQALKDRLIEQEQKEQRGRK